MNTYDKNQKYIIEDNIEALRILVDLGVLDLLTPKPGANSAYHCYQTEDHYCMASYHTGHGTKVDDGYLIVMVPRTEWTFKQAAHFFADAIVDTTEGISYGYKKVPNK
jgi:hypothetical protein